MGASKYLYGKPSKKFSRILFLLTNKGIGQYILPVFLKIKIRSAVLRIVYKLKRTENSMLIIGLSCPRIVSVRERGFIIISRYRKSFNAKFKSDFVIQFLKGENDIKTLATENNIQLNLLRNWKKE